MTCRLIALTAFFFLAFGGWAQQYSVAREWNEAQLLAIRNDFARPPVHARNLYHVSLGMYDAWAAYDPIAQPVLLGNNLGGYSVPFEGVPTPTDLEAAREEAISYAAYRILSHRFEFSPGAAVTLPYFNGLMAQLGYDISFTDADYSSGSPAALGNYIAQQVIAFGLQDGSNEAGEYSNTFYLPINDPIDMTQPGNPDMTDPNRWQPLELPLFVDQAGNPFTEAPPFQSPEWGYVTPFALTDDDLNVYTRDGDLYPVYLDPGPPPLIDTLGPRENDDLYRLGFTMVSVWQSHNDPTDGVLWDISPASKGNLGELPTDMADLLSVYDYFDGGDTGTGHPINPHTGLPYEPQVVPRGDYTRILAEFWADGPDSETPPGHWFSIHNYVTDQPSFQRRWMGEGPELAPLEWDVKAYLTLGGTVHDAAIAAWSVKGWFDYVRPVSAIRFMADRGQYTDPELSSYSTAGIPLMEGFVELVEAGDPLAGENGENIGKIKLYSWRGPDYIVDPEIDVAGVGWILAENWWPYQRPTFVTPPFAGYVSGHSTFSRAAAECMTAITGDAFFPGGMGVFPAPQNEFLVFEDGPSVDIVLQWATYRDASDQCSLSRIWGGIHPPADDIPGRLMGIQAAERAVNLANTFIFAGLPSVVAVEPSQSAVNIASAEGEFTLTITYNSPMDVSAIPVVSFPNLNPAASGALTLVSGAWTDATTFVATYSVTNTGETLLGIDVAVSQGLSSSGNLQNEGVFTGVFSVDFEAPELLTIECVDGPLNRSYIGSSYTIDFTFNEAMLLSQPAIVAPGPTLNSLIASGNEGQWLTDFVFRAAAPIADVEIENAVLEALVSAADKAGNPIEILASNSSCIVDTRNPLLVSITANPQDYNPVTTTDNTVVLTLLFDEGMDETILPTIELTALNAFFAFNAAESAWLDPLNFEAVFNESGAPLDFTSIGAVVTQVKDAVGNSMPELLIDEVFTSSESNQVGVLRGGSPLMLYPNPLESGQQLRIQSSEPFDHIRLYATDGRLIHQQRFPRQQKLAELTFRIPAGMYFIEVSTEMYRTRQRIVVR